MAIPLSNEIRDLLDKPNFAHLATLLPDGSPQSVPVWVSREENRIPLGTGEGSLKAKNTRRDPRVSLSIVDFHDPYEEAQLRGRVVERRPDGDFKVMDAISQKYRGKPFPFRSPDEDKLVDAAGALEVYIRALKEYQLDEKSGEEVARLAAVVDGGWDHLANAYADIVSTHEIAEVQRTI